MMSRRRIRRRVAGLVAAVSALAAVAGCGPGSSAPENPLRDVVLFRDPQAAAAVAEQQLRDSGRSAEADRLTAISSQPVATWLVDDGAAATARRVTDAAEVLGQVPVLVLYHRPGRDCGSYSAGGATELTGYLTWLDQVIAAVGDRRAVVVVEPDALAQAVTGQCALDGRPEATYDLLRQTVQRLDTHPALAVYVDAGHPGWVTDVELLAGALRSSGLAIADGFSLNVSNFVATADTQAYGDAVSAATDDAQYVVDVSRNGVGSPVADPGSVDAWCNPAGAALGQNPQIGPDRARAVAYLWVKEPGVSDGSCRAGEPPAGQFWLDTALRLVDRRP